MIDIPLRCVSCGDVLGSYEPVIVQERSVVRETSRTAESDLSPVGVRLWHRECYVSGLAGTLPR